MRCGGGQCIDVEDHGAGTAAVGATGSTRPGIVEVHEGGAVSSRSRGLALRSRIARIHSYNGRPHRAY